MGVRVALSSWLPDALPSPTGAARWPLLIVWSVLLAVSLWSTAAVLPGVYRAIAAPVSPSAAAGLNLAEGGVGLILGPPATPEAARAGLRRGDRLVAIDGEPAVFASATLDRQLEGARGTTVEVTTISPSGASGQHVLRRDPEAYRQALGRAGLDPTWARLFTDGLRFLFKEVMFLACAIVLMVRRSRDPLAPWASLMMLCMVLGNSGAGIWFAQQFPNVLLANYIANAAAFGLVVIVLCVFPDGRFDPRWSLAVAVVGVMLTVISEPMPSAVSNILLVVTQVGAVAAIGVRYRRMPAGIGRQQIRWALLGFAASLVALFALSMLQFARMRTDSASAFIWINIGASFSSAAMLALLMAGLTISLLRYRLYDADATISRSVVYSALTLALLAIFAGSEKVIEVMGEEYLGEELGALAGGLGAAFAAVMMVPMHHRVTRWAEKRFRSGLVRLRHGLPLLVGDMRETATPAALADATLLRVERGVRARHGAVVVDGTVLDARGIGSDAVARWLVQSSLQAGDEPTIQLDRSDKLFPVRLPLLADGTGLVGWLLLGSRPDGSFYSRDEREALQDVSDPVARALAIAIERESREAARQEREDGLHRRFDALRRFVHERLGFDVDREPTHAA